MSEKPNSIENIKKNFVQYNDENAQKILYQPCVRVEKIKNNNEIQNLINEMKKAVKGVGIGLAANQIGHSLQIFMIEFTSQKHNPAHTSRYNLDFPSVPFQVFINPKIILASQEKIAFWHGCLSAADKFRGLVSTYKWIEYEAYDEQGEYKKGRLDDMGAIIFQHEFRHLLGSLYIDHAKEFKSLDELNELFVSKKISPYQLASSEVPLLLSDYNVGESVEEYSKRHKNFS